MHKRSLGKYINSILLISIALIISACGHKYGWEDLRQKPSILSSYDTVAVVNSMKLIPSSADTIGKLYYKRTQKEWPDELEVLKNRCLEKGGNLIQIVNMEKKMGNVQIVCDVYNDSKESIRNIEDKTTCENEIRFYSTFISADKNNKYAPVLGIVFDKDIQYDFFDTTVPYCNENDKDSVNITIKGIKYSFNVPEDIDYPINVVVHEEWKLDTVQNTTPSFYFGVSNGNSISAMPIVRQQEGVFFKHGSWINMRNQLIDPENIKFHILDYDNEEFDSYLMAMRMAKHLKLN